MNLTQNSFVKLVSVDPEMLYVATESAQSLFLNKQTVKTIEVVNEIAKSVAGLIIERNTNEKLKFTEKEFIELAKSIAFSSYHHEIPKERTVNDLAVLIAEASMYYAGMRELGMPSIIQEVYVNNYWPFGQEGGFCNPMKIKIMNEN